MKIKHARIFWREEYLLAVGELSHKRDISRLANWRPKNIKKFGRDLQHRADLKRPQTTAKLYFDPPHARPTP